MSLDPATVRRIAKLARIRVAEDQLAPLQAQLNGIIGWIEQLQEVNVDGIAPLTGGADMALRMREDQVTDGGIAEQVLANAPDRVRRLLRRPEGGGMTILTELGITAAAEGLRSRQFSARELTQAHVRAIEALDGQLNAFITPTPELALTARRPGGCGAVAWRCGTIGRYPAGNQRFVLHQGRSHHRRQPHSRAVRAAL